VFGSGLGFNFGFRVWVPRQSTRFEPAPLPSLGGVQFSHEAPKEIRFSFNVNVIHAFLYFNIFLIHVTSIFVPLVKIFFI